MEHSADKLNREATLALGACIAQNALCNFDDIPSRIGVVLLGKGLIVKPDSVEEDAEILAVISDENHPNRHKLCAGPLVAHTVDGKTNEIFVAGTSELLLSRDKRARVAAFNHFLRIARRIDHPQPERLEKFLTQHEQKLVSDEDSEWSAAAVRLVDFINDDFFLNLATFRQFLELRHNEGLFQLFPKLLNPAPQSIDWIEVFVPTPTQQHSLIEQFIRESAENASSLIAACDVYYEKLGTLPLQSRFSLGQIFDVWNLSHLEVQDVWKQLWLWAEGKETPLARYHVCAFFCERPHLIPEGEFDRLWDEMLEIIFVLGDLNPDSKWREAWMMRIEIAKHYVKFFECQKPGRNSEAFARFAWWLAEKVSIPFGVDSKFIAHVRNSILKNIITNSDLIWQTASPPLQASALRHGTTSVNSVWSLALQEFIAARLGELKIDVLSVEKVLQIERAVGFSACSWFPIEQKVGVPTTYAFERGVRELCAALAALAQDQKRAQELVVLVNTIDAVKAADQLLSKLRDLPDADFGLSFILAVAFRVRAELDTLPVEDVWKLICDDKWRSDVFLKLDIVPLQSMFEALNILQIRAGELWQSNLSHFFASAAESACRDDERRKALFLFTILSSISSDTTSAIERLLKGKHKKVFIEETAFWRGQFGKIMAMSPPWVAARIRPVAACLSSI